MNYFVKITDMTAVQIFVRLAMNVCKKHTYLRHHIWPCVTFRELLIGMSWNLMLRFFY